MDKVKKRHPVRTAFAKLWKNKLATICFFVLIIEILMVVFAPIIAPYDYAEQDPANRLRPGIWAKNSDDPNPANQYVEGHILGTDGFGRDNFSRLLYGGRISLMVGFVSTGMGLVAGVLFGLLAGLCWFALGAEDGTLAIVTFPAVGILAGWLCDSVFARRFLPALLLSLGALVIHEGALFLIQYYLGRVPGDLALWVPKTVVMSLTVTPVIYLLAKLIGKAGAVK